MSDNARVHDFGADHPVIMRLPKLRRAMATVIADDDDVSAAENYAAALDAEHGGNDAAVGAAFGYLFAVSNDRRDVIERVIMACDSLRQSRRTKH